MKKQFIKFLPIAAAILLATSCSKDGDNGDSNVVNNPDPETTEVVNPDGTRVVPFSITVNTGKPLSKIAYHDTKDETSGKWSVIPSFEESDKGMEMLISSADNSVFGDLTLSDDYSSGIFSGNLTVTDKATAETALTGTITVPAKSGENSNWSHVGIEDLMGKCGHTYEANFKYGTNDMVELVDVANSYLEIKCANKGGAEVDISGKNYTLNSDSKIWLMVSPNTKITSTALDISNESNRTTVAGKIHTIDRTIRVSITNALENQYIDSKYIWGSTETIPLTATVSSSDATDQTIEWTVTSGLATVNEDGEVTITGMGEVVITATATADNVSGSYTINVSEDYVDLGLTKEVNGKTVKVLWATKNVGADSPWDYGDYFAWGETEPYYSDGAYSASPTWKTGKKKGYTWNVYFDGEYGSNFTIYKNQSTPTLSSKHDAATQNDVEKKNMMPEKSDFEALLQCPKEWTGKYDNKTFNEKDAAGYIFYKKYSNKKDMTTPHIFLPAAGYRNNTKLVNDGTYMNYWSSSLYTAQNINAWFLLFQPDNTVQVTYMPRAGGLSVRPIRRVE